MSCRCIDCKYYVAGSISVGNTIFLTFNCKKKSTKLNWLAVKAEKDCSDFISNKYPYYTSDPERCPYFDDLSDCPTVQEEGHCPLTCGALVEISSPEDEENFNAWLEELGYMGDDFL